MRSALRCFDRFCVMSVIMADVCVNLDSALDELMPSGSESGSENGGGDVPPSGDTCALAGYPDGFIARQHYVLQSTFSHIETRSALQSCCVAWALITFGVSLSL